MHPQEPPLVQHGSPSGKHALVHTLPPHDVLALINGFIGAGLPPPGLDPEPVSVGAGAELLLFTHAPKLQT